MQKRAAVCDFTPFKALIDKYPGPEILVVMDADFAFGQNFYLVVTEDAVTKVMDKLNPPKPAEEEKPKKKKAEDSGEAGEDGGESGVAVEEEESESEDEFAGQVFTYEPPTPKEWLHLGSDKEIMEEQFCPSRKKFEFLLSKPWKDFGAPVNFAGSNTLFKDASEQVDVDDESHQAQVDRLDVAPDNGLVERHQTHCLQTDTAIQAKMGVCEVEVQTNWTVKHNLAVQTEARDLKELKPYMDEDTGDMIDPLEINVDMIRPAFEQILNALEQNAIGNLFEDDWSMLGSNVELGSNVDTHLREYQSFTDLTHSKDKRVSWCEWHPTINGILACAVSKRLTLDERIDQLHKNITNPAYILIWSFSDPIHPKLLLEAPDDVMCFRFCPTDPNMIIGGCFNGQIAIWDIKDYSDKLSMNTTKSKDGKGSGNASQFGEEPEPETPKINYSAVSAVDKGSIHKAPVSYLNFVPPHFEFDKQGNPCEPQHPTKCTQIITCATDGYIAIWDVRKQQASKMDQLGQKEEKQAVKSLQNNEFAHLDLVWKPLVRVHVLAPQQTTFLTPTTLSLFERFPKNLTVNENCDDGDRLPEKVASNKNLNQLNSICTDYYAGTDDGVIIKSQIKYEKDNESGKMAPAKAKWHSQAHDATLGSVLANPMYPEIVLGVGGWNFSLWNLSEESIESGNSQMPLLTSPLGKVRYSCARWSETRPSCFYLGTDGGGIEIWDVLERTNEPALKQSVSSTSITNIQLKIISPRQHLLAISDASGTVHILQVPYILRAPNQPNELQYAEAYFKREVDRIDYFNGQIDLRANGFIGSGDAQPTKAEEKLSEEDQTAQDTKFYGSFSQFEKGLRSKLGLDAAS